jgi:hypothetical protein
MTHAVTPFEHKKKTAIFCPCSPSERSKGITRATNAKVRIAQNDPLVHAVSREHSGVTALFIGV